MRATLRSGIRDLNPGYFALVMATGIVSTAMRLDGQHGLSGFLLGAGIVAYLVLLAAYAARFAAFRTEFLADAASPRKAFAFFTFVAASDVLSARLTLDGHTAAAAVLLGVGGAGWLLLSYSVPVLLAGRSSLPGANGTWFLWVVGTESIAVSSATLLRPAPESLAALATGCWAVGVVLYLLIAVAVTIALLSYPVKPAELTPPYWVFMGATAISVLAGGLLLGLPAGPLSGTMHAVVAGISFMLWAFGTWLIPLLLVAGAWRHLVRRFPLGYEPGMWSIVFPVGMYGVGSRVLGQATGVSWLVTLGRYEAWLALAVWLAVAVAMVAFLARQAVTAPAAPPR